MTGQTVLILTAIVLVFVLFGSVLAWAEAYTRGARQPGSVAAPAARPADLVEDRRAA